MGRKYRLWDVCCTHKTNQTPCVFSYYKQGRTNNKTQFLTWTFSTTKSDSKILSSGMFSFRERLCIFQNIPELDSVVFKKYFARNVTKTCFQPARKMWQKLKGILLVIISKCFGHTHHSVAWTVWFQGQSLKNFAGVKNRDSFWLVRRIVFCCRSGETSDELIKVSRVRCLRRKSL